MNILTKEIALTDNFVVSNRLCLSLLILSRQQLIRILYTSLKDKSRIRLKKKVIGIHPLESGVSVSIEDGDVYYGDLVVGADGVHSMTRSELWRVASEAGLGEMTLRDKSSKQILFELTYVFFDLNLDIPSHILIFSGNSLSCGV